MARILSHPARWRFSMQVREICAKIAPLGHNVQSNWTKWYIFSIKFDPIWTHSNKKEKYVHAHFDQQKEQMVKIKLFLVCMVLLRPFLLILHPQLLLERRSIEWPIFLTKIENLLPERSLHWDCWSVKGNWECYFPLVVSTSLNDRRPSQLNKYFSNMSQ